MRLTDADLLRNRRLNHTEVSCGTITDIERTLRVEIVFRQMPLRRTVEWPRDRFVEYERSDESWAVPCGFATEHVAPLEQGDIAWLGDYVTICDAKMVLSRIDVRMADNAVPLFIAEFECIDCDSLRSP